MPEQDRPKIEDIKRHLYDVDDTITHRRHEGALHPVHHDVVHEWNDNTNAQDEFVNYAMKKPPTSIFKKFFFGTLIFFVCAVGFSLYMFYGKSTSVSNDNIAVAVLGNAFTKGGDTLPLQIEITNHNNAELDLANLIISYPRGASDDPTDVVRLARDSIGTIAAGATVTRNITVTLYGDEKSTRNIDVSLEYHPPNSNAIFSKDVEYPVVISAAPLSLVIDAPAEATSDQDVTFTITASLNTTLPDTSTIVQVTYPNSFVFESATPAPIAGNGTWSLASLSLTKPVVITLTGRLVGQDGDQQVFHVYAGAPSPTDQSAVKVIYNSLLSTVTIAKPFLEADVLVDNQDLESYTAGSGDTIHAEISWTNNLSNMISDAQIIANLSGNAFDKTSVDPGEGFYNSATNQIIWDKNSIPDLASVQPGTSGKVSFTLKSISLVGSPVTIASPQIAIDVSIKGQQPNIGGAFSDINNFSKKIIKILSDFQIASSAVFSSGPLPPKAESKTTYTVTWTLSNSANNISGAVARAALPIYVTWVGPAAGSKENVTYNSVTREVIWNIGSVSPNTGFSATREASFDVSLSPSTSQIGSIPQLMKDVSLSGTDSFTNTPVTNTYKAITTTLNNDPQFSSGDDRVVQ